VAAEEASKYHSPKRCLALSFRLSRDRWKRKAADRLATIHSLRGRVRDLALSRDLWKRKALYYQDLLREAGRLPAADLLPPDAFAPAPPLPAEAPAPFQGGVTAIAEAATRSPAGASLDPAPEPSAAPAPPLPAEAPAAEFVAPLEPTPVPASEPPAVSPEIPKKKARRVRR
jgi:hypothetical protein